MAGVHDVEVIEDPAAAVVALDPVRARLLAELAEPASAAALAARLGITRQKVNYHLRALELHGLVELAEERHHGGIIERLLQATAASYVVSPAAVDERRGRPRRAPDRPIGPLPRGPRRPGRARGRRSSPAAPSPPGKRLPTMAIDTEIGFRSAAEDRAAFADELTEAVVDARRPLPPRRRPPPPAGRRRPPPTR